MDGWYGWVVWMGQWMDGAGWMNGGRSKWTMNVSYQNIIFKIISVMPG